MQNVQYVKGHAGIVVTGADETSNLTVFSVGKANAVNQTLFKEDEDYDGVADLAFVAIKSANGKFGGLRTANVSYWANEGVKGVYAPGVEFEGPVFVGDIEAQGEATPMLEVGSASDLRITGGALRQWNGLAMHVRGFAELRFTAGTTSHGKSLPAAENRARFVRDGAT